MPLAGGPGTVVRDSVAVAAWTILSRMSGLGRVAVTAAVLGPTYLGNTFQAMNMVPKLAYELLTGTLFAALLIPPLVRHVDRRDARATERFVGGFLTLALLVFAAATVVAVLAGPLIMRVFTLGVADPAVAAAQRRAGWLLLALFMPQVLLYAVAGVGGAVMNAHGRFALAAAAPALENVGVVVTLVTSALVFGSGIDLFAATDGQLLLLGAGTTAAVGLHAGLVWWGTWRVGICLVPRAGWRDPEVWRVVRRAVPSSGYAGLNAVAYFALLVAANRVSGGVVALTIAMHFYALPIAVGAEPVAVALRPLLSRLHHDRALQLFRDELVRGAALTGLLVVPAATGVLVLAAPLARAVSTGAMASPAAVTLVAAALTALAVGIIAESAFKLATDASYAREDARAPFQAMLVRTGVTLAGIALSFALSDGTSVLMALGGAVSAGTLAGAAYLAVRIRAGLPSAGESLAPAVTRSVTASLVMVGPAYLVANNPPAWIGGHSAEALAMLAGAVVGGGVFLALHQAWRSPELHSLISGLSLSSGRLRGPT